MQKKAFRMKELGDISWESFFAKLDKISESKKIQLVGWCVLLKTPILAKKQPFWYVKSLAILDQNLILVCGEIVPPTECLYRYDTYKYIHVDIFENTFKIFFENPLLEENLIFDILHQASPPPKMENSCWAFILACQELINMINWDCRRFY